MGLQTKLQTLVSKWSVTMGSVANPGLLTPVLEDVAVCPIGTRQHHDIDHGTAVSMDSNLEKIYPRHAGRVETAEMVFGAANLVN